MLLRLIHNNCLFHAFCVLECVSLHRKKPCGWGFAPDPTAGYWGAYNAPQKVPKSAVEGHKVGKPLNIFHKSAPIG